jgi:hypothetical protein
LARTIISHAIPAEAREEEYGYGISTTLQDNEYPILVVDIPAQKIFALPKGKLVKGKVTSRVTAKTYTFEDFIKTTEDIRKDCNE